MKPVHVKVKIRLRRSEKEVKMGKRGGQSLLMLRLESNQVKVEDFGLKEKVGKETRK